MKKSLISWFIASAEDLKSLFYILLFIGVLILGYSWYQQWEETRVPGAGLIIYPVQCDDWFKVNPPVIAQNFQSCAQRRALNREALKIDKTNQQVIKWSPDDASHQFYKEADCAIIDSDNWSCNNAAFASMGFGFNNGKYFDNGFTHVIFVSKTQWNSINNGAPTPFGANVLSR